MEILKTKIAIMGSRLTGLSNSEIEILASSAKHRIGLSKGINDKQTVVDG
ncbi:hypothetical protein MWMV17_MWMV17_00572 [Acinetobacter calcoaceticus]|uniref:Uncharacterized protein n=1 Tax=Acinetobacter calcoaceticus DSM 30006 = CIP 81.8 TaxID=981331 RepID=A0ABN0K5V5_ACICA|nr:hypothetical protein F936_01979 [Acinetobacter calcoaceticus DSM 30006 = CIP 81.8]CAI3109465.1 hypothetical protein MWMV17_MWMV17_00572 [Acinetobacter calcoaceticus]SUU56112.1 Uncharacterised protein [Acinetobacter calcoaceticus]